MLVSLQSSECLVRLVTVQLSYFLIMKLTQRNTTRKRSFGIGWRSSTASAESTNDGALLLLVGKRTDCWHVLRAGRARWSLVSANAWLDDGAPRRVGGWGPLGNCCFCWSIGADLLMLLRR